MAWVALTDCSRVSYEPAVWDRKHLGSYSCTPVHEQQYILCLEEVYMYIFILHFIPVEFKMLGLSNRLYKLHLKTKIINLEEYCQIIFH